VFDAADYDAHEHVSWFCDGGLKMIVAIHRTGPLGTAGGGCRMWPYPDARAGLSDALRLSRAMTYKLALLEIPAGGAKAVVIGDPSHDRSEALLLAIGRAVERLGGRYIVSEDVGIGPAELAVIGRETKWVSPHAGGADTAVPTAHGLLVCIRVAVRAQLGRDSLHGLTVAIRGFGRVGRALARALHAEGARLIVADIDHRTHGEARRLGARWLTPDEIFDAEADVFAPCALGGVLDAETVPRLRCKVIAGSANNQLAYPSIADALAARGILYAPDFVVNGGGVLGTLDSAERLAPIFQSVLDRAAREQITPHAAAEKIARERFRAMGGRP
jgi:leucine dehydrogenase